MSIVLAAKLWPLAFTLANLLALVWAASQLEGEAGPEALSVPPLGEERSGRD